MLAVFNAASIQTWATTLPPNWGSQTVSAMADVWSSRLADAGPWTGQRRPFTTAMRPQSRRNGAMCCTGFGFATTRSADRRNPSSKSRFPFATPHTK